ncbi:hypothetical protein [Halalkalibacter flavus]|uniref:hypothetical protein n=1 Tax=Halalkalibacter flavus TaxID=3090668 RepID=UPI002FC6F10A
MFKGSNVLKVLLVGLLVFTSALTPGFIGTVSAQNSDISVKDFENENFHVILEKDNIIIYQVHNDDGTISQFEEETVEYSGNKTVIYTEIYDVINNEKVFVDNFKTEILSEGDSIQIIQKDNNEVELELNETNEESTQMIQARSNWTTVSWASGNFGYYTNYSTNRGNARYSTMSKTNLPRNSNYSTFIRNVDELKRQEVAILADASGVALLEALWQARHGVTLSLVKNLIKKIGAPLYLAYSGFNWALQVNRTTNSYYAL